MPKLWNQTIEAHRHAVHEAIMNTTSALVAEHGLMSVTMSQIAEATGIGRATLYKYFPDVQAILAAWHRQHIDGHLNQLAGLRDQEGPPAQRLTSVLTAYAFIAYHRKHHGGEMAALLHRDEHVRTAQQHLTELIEGLLSEVAQTNGLRDDVPLPELAAYCLHALSAAGDLPTEAAVHRLVTVTVDGLGAN